jgi:hypothetical protein
MSAAKRVTPPARPGWFRRTLTWIQSDAPLYAIAGIAFAGSLGHEVEVALRYGQHGAEAWSTAMVIDLFCYGAAYERMRDKRKGIRSKWFVSMPTLALFIGVVLTLAMNLETATPGAWGHIVAGLPGGLLLIVIALLERREGFEAKIAERGAAQRSETPQNASPVSGGNDGNANVPASRNATVPAGRSGGSRSGSGAEAQEARAVLAAESAVLASPPDTKPAMAFRSEGDLQDEALAILTAHKAATGERMTTADLGKALHVAKKRAITIRAEIQDREEAA